MPVALLHVSFFNYHIIIWRLIEIACSFHALTSQGAKETFATMLKLIVAYSYIGQSIYMS